MNWKICVENSMFQIGDGPTSSLLRRLQVQKIRHILVLSWVGFSVSGSDQKFVYWIYRTIHRTIQVTKCLGILFENLTTVFLKPRMARLLDVCDSARNCSGNSIAKHYVFGHGWCGSSIFWQLPDSCFGLWFTGMETFIKHLAIDILENLFEAKDVKNLEIAYGSKASTPRLARYS